MSDIKEYSIIEDFDRQKFIDLALESYGIDSESLTTDLDFDEPINKIEQWLDNRDIIRIVKSKEDYVGYMLAREYHNGTELAMSLQIIWTHPDFRGNGIATNFFKVLEDIARDNDNRFISGNCHISRVTFFESLGCNINMGSGNNFKLFRKAL